MEGHPASTASAVLEKEAGPLLPSSKIWWFSLHSRMATVAMQWLPTYATSTRELQSEERASGSCPPWRKKHTQYQRHSTTLQRLRCVLSRIVLSAAARWRVHPQVSRSRAASAVMTFLERHRGEVLAAAEREDCRKADADAPGVSPIPPPPPSQSIANP